MRRRIVESLFFSNYFLGILAIALSLETSCQLSLPFNSVLWYVLLFSLVVIYYTYAYVSLAKATATANPRTAWYADHQRAVRISQSALSLLFALAAILFIARYHHSIKLLPWTAWITLLLTLSVAIAYYGKLPLPNLRQAGWTKPIAIGFCWAVTVSLMPLIVLFAEKGSLEIPVVLAVWLFLKNWMFCSVNAILFDIKDFHDDSNSRLKTFVVDYGIRFTIMSILLPMITAGILFFLFFAAYSNFGIFRISANLIPFLLTFVIAWSMQKRKPILYYLIIIDGMLLVKALCGIAASVAEQTSIF